MTSILVKALEDLLEVKNHKDIAGKDAWYNSNQPKAWQQAREALSLYSQSMEGDYEKLLETVKIALSYRDFGVLNEYLINAGHEKISQSKENEGKQAERVNNAFDKLVGENYTLRSLIKTSFFYCNQQLNSEWVKFQNEMGLSDESKKEIVSLNKIHAECPHCKSLFDIDPPSGTFIHPSPPVPPIESGERGEVERLKGEIEFLESEIGRLGGFIYKPK